jgi:uncharacterized protein (TIGR03089 family)
VSENTAPPAWRDVAELVAWGTSREPATPFLTYYDDRTGERVELSYATFANWVAKTTHLLRDDLGVGPGSRVQLALPSHWQSFTLAVAAWAVGATVVPVDDPATLTGDGVVVTDEAGLAAVLPRREELGFGDVLALSLRPMGAGLTAVRPGVVDYALEVAAHGDDLPAPSSEGMADETAVVVGDAPVTVGALLDLAVDQAAAHDLGPEDRVLVVIGDGLLDDGLLAGGLACFVAGAGMVLCLGIRGVDLPGRATTERVSVVVGPAGWLAEAAGETPPAPPPRLRLALARGEGEAPENVLGAEVRQL